MAQKLLLPFRRSMIICGYKTDAYRSAWKYDHYGIDVSTYQGVVQKEHCIRASGDGKVVAKGNDGSLGIGFAIVYNDCISRNGEKKNLVARYVHCKTVYVNVGQTVKAGDIIAEEGKEGTSSFHLHFELDTDTRWPTYTPQVSPTNHSFWKKGTDSTVNPSLWLWQKPFEAALEPYNFSNRAWINTEDDNIPVASYNADEEIEALKKQIQQLQVYKEKYENLRSALEELIKKY